MGFTGKEADEEVGLVYFGERYLTPRIGRWASPDPLHVHAVGGGEALNSYHYVSGNLLAGRDPLGLDVTVYSQRRGEAPSSERFTSVCSVAGGDRGAPEDGMEAARPISAADLERARDTMAAQLREVYVPFTIRERRYITRYRFEIDVRLSPAEAVGTEAPAQQYTVGRARDVGRQMGLENVAVLRVRRRYAVGTHAVARTSADRLERETRSRRRRRAGTGQRPEGAEQVIELDRDPPGEPPFSDVRGSAAHEAGHLLGPGDTESPDEGLMSPRDTAEERAARRLSPRESAIHDAATRLAPGYRAADPSQQPTGRPTAPSRPATGRDAEDRRAR